MVLLISGDGFRTSQEVREAMVHAALKSCEAHFRKLYIEKYRDGHEGNFSQYHELCQCFGKAAQDEALGQFFDARGPDGRAWRYKEHYQDDFSPLLAKLEKQIPITTTPDRRKCPG